MAKVIGLTGGFGTGKSLVAAAFRRRGAIVLDADRIAHEALRRGSPVYRKVVGAFGPGVVSGPAISRRRLGAVVFCDKEALERLTGIIHPYVIERIRAAIGKAGRYDAVVIDAPLLIEAGLDRICDILVVVTCRRAQQIARCMKKFGLSRAEVLRRMNNQIPVGKKVPMADFVIDNSGTKPETNRQAERVWKEIVWR